jgi:hypothetical protein
MPDIQIIQIDPVTGLSTLGIGDNPVELTGIDLLAQVVALSYLRNPGQDVIDPVEGSGIRQDIGQTTVVTSDQANMLVLQRTTTVETEVLTRQAAAAVVDPTEKLKSLTVLDVASNLENAQVVASIKVLNEAGESTQILV